MNLCKNCVHFVADNVERITISRFHKCASPKNGINPVNGEIFLSHCDVNRQHRSSCGPSGSWFVNKFSDATLVTGSAKVPFWKVLLKKLFK
jgi:hypothetical protein